MKWSTVTEALLISMLLVNADTAVGQSVPNKCETAAHPVTETGSLTQVGTSFYSDGGLVRISSPGSRYLRARVELTKNADCGWYLTIRDGKYRAIQTLTSDDFASSPSRWTARIPGSASLLDLTGCGRDADPQLLLQEYIAMPDSAEHPYYSAQDPSHPKFKDLYEEVPKLRPYGDFVGFMMSSWTRDSWTCSGVMVASNIFLTNWHCGAPTSDFPVEGYWNDDIVRDTIIDLSWDGDDVSREYNGSRLLTFDPDLDFALIEVTPINWSGKARPVFIRRNPISLNESILVIQHPAARTKQVSLDCTIVDDNVKSWRKGVEHIDFAHKCDTEAGSSGAPVLDTDGRLIGLHHRGFDVDPKTCRQTDRMNKAVRIDKILEFLDKQKPELLKRISVQ